MAVQRHTPSAIHDPLGLVAAPLVPKAEPAGISDPFSDDRARVATDSAKSEAVVTILKTVVCALITLLVVVGLVAPSGSTIDPGPSAATRISTSDGGSRLRTIRHLVSTSHKPSDRALVVQR